MPNLLEMVRYKKGHKNSKGELAPWTIVSHKTGKILSSHKTKAEAEKHLSQMEYFKHVKTESLRTALEDGYRAIYESVVGDLKRKYINKIYRAAEPFLKRMHRDDNWQDVYSLFDQLKKLVPECSFSLGTENGGYSDWTGKEAPSRKTYTIDVDTPENVHMDGELICDGAGSVEDPLSIYDMTLLIY